VVDTASSAPGNGGELRILYCVVVLFGCTRTDSTRAAGADDAGLGDASLLRADGNAGADEVGPTPDGHASGGSGGTNRPDVASGGGSTRESGTGGNAGAAGTPGATGGAGGSVDARIADDGPESDSSDVPIPGRAPDASDARPGSFAATGSMTIARVGHSMTMLHSGKALIAGGQGLCSGILSHAELYDPATGSFSRTGSMTTARIGHAAVSLPNGKVLIAGGADAAGALSSAELYDPLRALSRPPAR